MIRNTCDTHAGWADWQDVGPVPGEDRLHVLTCELSTQVLAERVHPDNDRQRPGAGEPITAHDAVGRHVPTQHFVRPRGDVWPAGRGPSDAGGL